MSSTVTISNSASSPYHPKRPRRFAPLDRAKPNEHDAPQLKGIIFDVDGTLCLPQNYMFAEMRSALSISRGIDILDYIHSLPSTPDSNSDPDSSSSPQSRATEAIRAIERRAMSTQRPQPGLVELMTYLSERKVRKALCTRNFPAPVHHLLGKYLDGHVFEPIITRETAGVAPKPSPKGLWAIVRSWDQSTVGEDARGDLQSDRVDDVLELARRVLGEGIIMVGDSIDDMAAGYRAGAATVLLANEENEHLVEHEYTDLAVRRLDELIQLLDEGFAGRGPLAAG